MAEQVTIARPYAEAVFALARAENALPVWSRMIKLASEVAGDSQMRIALDDPRLPAPAKESLFLSICGDALNPEGRNFIRVLLQAGRVSLLPHIVELFDRLKDGVDGVARAHIVSAYPVDDVQLGALRSALAKRFGKTIETTVSVDPKLIGGVKVTVGDTVIDGSVERDLQAMRNRLRA